MYMIDGIGTSKNVYYKLLTAKVFPLRVFFHGPITMMAQKYL